MCCMCVCVGRRETFVFFFSYFDLTMRRHNIAAAADDGRKSNPVAVPMHWMNIGLAAAAVHKIESERLLAFRLHVSERSGSIRWAVACMCVLCARVHARVTWIYGGDGMSDESCVCAAASESARGSYVNNRRCHSHRCRHRRRRHRHRNFFLCTHAADLS